MRKIQLMALLIAFLVLVSCEKEYKKPNVIYVFADQWRAQATGYAGDVNAISIKTKSIYRLWVHSGH